MANDQRDAMILCNSSFDLPNLICILPSISSFLPSSYIRSLSVNSANFCLSLPFCSFQFPFTSVVFIIDNLAVKEFSHNKGALLFTAYHYTIPLKDYIIYILGARLHYKMEMCLQGSKAMSHHRIPGWLKSIIRAGYFNFAVYFAGMISIITVRL